MKKAWPTTLEAVSFTLCRHSFNLPGAEQGSGGWHPAGGWQGGPGQVWGRSPEVAVAVADGVPAQVAVAVARGEGVDDVLAVVVVPAAPVRVPVLPCRETWATGRARVELG